MYTISAASRLCGVPPETLRAWERRYELVAPRRDGRGRRMYRPEDVERLRLLRRGTALGHAISRLAPMSLDELRAVVEHGAVEEPSTGGDLGHLLARLLHAVEHYRADECDEVLGLAATLLAPKLLISEVIAPALQTVGERWHRGQASIAQERLLSASVRRTIGSLIVAYRRRATGPVLLLATLPGEPHELGLLMAALLVASEGVDCLYLGPDIPPEDLLHAARETEARCLGLSFVLSPPRSGSIDQVLRLARGLRPGCELWLGGGGARGFDRHALPDNCRRIASSEELRQRARILGGS